MLQRVEPFFGDLEEIFLANLEVMRVHGGVIEHLRQQLPPHIFLMRRRGLAQEAAFAGEVLDDPLRFESVCAFATVLRLTRNCSASGRMPGNASPVRSVPDAAASFTWSTSCK